MKKNFEILDLDELSKYHIPHFNFLQWTVNNKNKAAEASFQDKELRRIGVRFYLEDLRAGTQWVFLKLAGDLSQNISHENTSINIWFEKNEKGYLSSIVAELDSKGFIEAFKIASTLIFPIFSMLCFFYRRPLRLSRVIVKDIEYDIEIETKKYSAKAEDLINPLAAFKHSPIASLFSLYREGMNSLDVSYRYISFFKIYEAWKDKSKYFFNQESNVAPPIQITKKLLGAAFREKFHIGYIGKHINDKSVYDELNYIRKCLVHPMIDKGVPASYCNIDNIDHLEAIEAMSNLIERISTKILETELKIKSKHDEEIKKLLEVYLEIE